MELVQLDGKTKLQIHLDHVKQQIIINNVSIPAAVTANEPGERLAIFEPNKDFWDIWRKYKQYVKQIAPSEEHAKNWGADKGVIKQLGPIKVWSNPYDDSFRAYYDELKLFEDHEKKWRKINENRN